MKAHLKHSHSDLKGLSVLVIDDDPSTLWAVSQYLEHMGLETLVARDGASGMEKARYDRPDLILLDVRLPGADGFEICESLKSDENTKEIPVIFMTALTKTEHKIRGFNAGGVDYITKPLQFEEVLARVATHLQLDDLRRRLEHKVSDRTAQLTSTNKKLQQEIADHKQTAAALKESEARYRCLFEESPISLWLEDFSRVQKYFNHMRASGVTDFQTHFKTHPQEVFRCNSLIRPLDVNKATLNLVGAANKAELKANREKLFTEASLKVMSKGLINLAGGKLKFQGEAALSKLNGDPINVVICLRLAPGYETCMEKVMVSLLDITDRKRAEELLARQKVHLEKQTIALTRAKEEAEAADRAKDHFLANISHELRTPLNPILGYAQLLQHHHNLTEDQRGQIKDIQTSGEHLLALIDDIINFSQRNHCLTKTMADVFNLKQLIQHINNASSNKAAEKTIFFNYVEVSAIPERVIGHESRLKKVLIKLIDNAIKFTQQGGVTFRVVCTDMTAAPERRSDLAKVLNFEFQVIDTGTGIAKDKLDTIFDSFTKATLNGQWVEGMGLGLAICRQLVEMMGGTITVESEVGQGSTFTVALDMEAAV